ncbi:hypothetical protein HQ590_09430 [bacterium]|nr:hypothetical protein [bacterium]
MSRNLVALVLFGATTAVGGPPAVSDRIRAGDAALQRFDLDAARAAYRAAHQADPAHYEATWKLARALVDGATLTTDRATTRQLVLEAEQLTRRAVHLQPQGAKGHAYLAIAVGQRALFEGGRQKVDLSREVKREAEAALALNEREDLACHTLAIWHREMAQLNFVLRKFAEFLYGRFPPASLDEAVGYLQRARAIAPGVVAHRVELGITLADRRQWAAAREELEQALAMPKAWVTDDHYRELARQRLAIVRRHER